MAKGTFRRLEGRQKRHDYVPLQACKSRAPTLKYLDKELHLAGREQH